MRRTFGLAVLLAPALALSQTQPPAATPLPREGTVSSIVFSSATLNAMPLGKDRVQYSYESLGISTSQTGEGLLHNASMHCLGGFHRVNDAVDDESGSCIFTRPDGDQVFYVYKAAGKPHIGVKGTFTYVGGTGKMEGITGGGEFTRVTLRHAKEGTTQSVSQGKGTYKLP
jgi:hypothetical protein